MRNKTLLSTCLVAITVMSCKKEVEKGSPENDGSINPNITIATPGTGNLEGDPNPDGGNPNSGELDPINPERNPDEFKGRINFRVLNIKGDENAYFKDCLSLKVKETATVEGQSSGTFQVPFGCNKKSQKLQSLKDDDTFEKEANGDYIVKDVLYLQKEAKPYPYQVFEGTKVELNIAFMVTEIKVKGEPKCTPKVAKLNQGTHCTLETIYGNPKKESGLPDRIRRVPDSGTQALPTGAKCFKETKDGKKIYRIYFEDQPDRFFEQDKIIRQELTFQDSSGNDKRAFYDHPDEIQEAASNNRQYTITDAPEIFRDSSLKDTVLLRLKELVNKTTCLNDNNPNNDENCPIIGNAVDLSKKVTISERALDIIGIDYADLQLEIQAEKASLLVGSQDLDGSVCKDLK